MSEKLKEIFYYYSRLLLSGHYVDIMPNLAFVLIFFAIWSNLFWMLSTLGSNLRFRLVSEVLDASVSYGKDGCHAT